MLFLLIILPSLVGAVDVIDSGVTTSSGSSSDTFVIKLGGLFTVFHRGEDEKCDTSKVFSSSVQWIEMTMYTIDRINSDATLLPGIHLVLEPFADCLVDTRALQQIVEEYLPREPTTSRNNTYWGLIGPETSEVSVPTANLLGLFDIPQISFSATSPVLSNKRRFPFYFRTAPSDRFQVGAMIQLLKVNGWRYVSFIYEDNDYGTHAFDAFQTQTAGSSICIAVEIKLPRTPSEQAVDVMIERLASDSTANVVIVFATEYNLALILKSVHMKKMETRFQWIGSDTWNGIQINDLLVFLKNDSYTDVLNTAIDGAISLTLHSLPDENFETFIRTMTTESTKNPYFANYLAFLHKCSLDGSNPSIPLCPENMTLPDDQELSLMLQTAANAPMAYAHALHDAQKQLCKDPEVPVCDEFAKLTGDQLRQYLQNVSFPSSNNQNFTFDEFQDGPALYDIWRYDGVHSRQWELIGVYKDNMVNFYNETLAGGRGQISSTCGAECAMDEYMLFQEVQTCCWICVKCRENNIVVTNVTDDGNRTYCKECGNDFFASKMNRTCIPVSVHFLSFEEHWAWAVAVVSCFGLLLTIFTAIIYLCYWNTPLIRASGRELSSIILVGLSLAFVTSFFFCFEPTRVLCSLRRLATGISFSLIYSAILVKTVRISLIFNTLGRKLVRDYKRLLRPLPQVVIAAVLTSVEIFLLVIWLVMVPPEVAKRRSAALHDDIPTDFLDCSGLRDHVILIGISYPIILVLICSVYAFRIRKVPAGFNEAKHIGFAVYTTLVIWLAQVSTYLANSSTDVVLRDAIYCLGLSLNGLIILFAMFGPKIYIVMFRPEKNNQRMVMGTQASRMRSLSSQHHSSYSRGRVDDRKRSSQLPLPQVNNNNAHSDTCRNLYLKRQADVRSHVTNGVMPTTNGNAYVTEEEVAEVRATSPTNTNNVHDCDMTSSDEAPSVTSQDSRRWERDFMRSFDAIASSTQQKTTLRNNNDVKTIDDVIDTRMSRVYADDCFPKEKYGREKHGWLNRAFESEGWLERSRSLPKSSELFRKSTSRKGVRRNSSMKI
uniref:Metabotropic glutamate receptor 1-like n=1 Tax=Phallusia mammillata TaxID=59560 RepID=A0A6F9DE96_9ASCI|nr:metabotropic glutamate receptor 1-like [Phallusia mammillata]